MKRLIGGGLGAALALTLGPLVPAAPAPEAAAATKPRVLVREGPLTTRTGGEGQPAARQLESARVRYVLKTGRVTATAVLRGVPEPVTDAALLVGFGEQFGSTCASAPGAALWQTSTVSASGDGFSRSGRTISFALDAGEWKSWDCAFIAVSDPANVTSTYDMLSRTPLPAEYEKPRLVIGKPAILNQKPKRLPLVRGVWTTVRVPIRNTGPWRAANTVVTGKGPGLQVRRDKLGIVYDDSNQTARVQVRLKAARKQTRLRLVVRGGGVKATRTVPIRRVAAPARPAAGLYRGVGKNKNITFRVQNGRILGFRGKRFRMTCQPPMEYARYHYTDLTHRNRAVPRSGIVDDVHEWKKKGGNAWFTSMLEGRLVGNRLTRGRFAYYTSGSCRVEVRFAARRVGR
ncbi:hypothetical protein [Nocardioides massiliensis]|uniref:Uncharacterized protein n=1 Tax=Nocardioides massiliensis TaxID=1325935 RepID=A0ABT9NJG0_9ACTN|nr:hypothetical protein [Nocardioides massiliensis]MDP9820539.1 hypothetical protein [Nocardioides massiliensis]